MLELQKTIDFDWHAINPDLINLILSNGFYYIFTYRLC